VNLVDQYYLCAWSGGQQLNCGPKRYSLVRRVGRQSARLKTRPDKVWKSSLLANSHLPIAGKANPIA